MRSRSNPQEGAPNPAVRHFDWNSEAGTIRYYDKATKTREMVELPFTFLLLAQLGSVRGWHELSQSGIYSNEVADTRQDVLVVKAFKLRDPLAEGLYKDIKDRVNAAGARFVASCYIAFKHHGELAIGQIGFRGAALQAWMEFTKAHRGEVYEKAVDIVGTTEGKKGRVTYQMPAFALKPVSADTQARALDLDKTLQAYLADYLKRTKREQIEQVADAPMPDDADYPRDIAPQDDDIPF